MGDWVSESDLHLAKQRKVVSLEHNNEGHNDSNETYASVLECQVRRDVGVTAMNKAA